MHGIDSDNAQRRLTVEAGSCGYSCHLANSACRLPIEGSCLARHETCWF
jgi:hypothetical protein